MTQPQYLRVSAARKEYSLPRDRVYNAIATGELPATNVGTMDKASYILKRSDVEAWIERMRFRPGGQQ